MILRDRNLSIRMKGKDVKLLQSELRQIGFNITDKMEFFGKLTHIAVITFQKKHGLNATGVVNKITAIFINAELMHQRIQLFSKHPDFELTKTDIDVFFNQKEVAQMCGKDVEKVKCDLKAIQRIFKLVPTYEKTAELLKEDFSSAANIYVMGEAEFVKRFSGNRAFTKKEAKTIYRKAANIVRRQINPDNS